MVREFNRLIVAGLAAVALAGLFALAGTPRSQLTVAGSTRPTADLGMVLLIIFMVAAPLSTVDVPVELPVSNAQPQPRPDKPVFLTIKSDLSYGFRLIDLAGVESH